MFTIILTWFGYQLNLGDETAFEMLTVTLTQAVMGICPNPHVNNFVLHLTVYKSSLMGSNFDVSQNLHGLHAMV